MKRHWSSVFALAAICASAASLANGPIPTGEPMLMSASAQTFWRASRSGGPPKDGIPSIDEPRFVRADEADRWLAATDRVIGAYHQGEARAYPQSIMVWHEIVNDTISGRPLAVTYCPLTGTAIGFERGSTELGVSGRLVNSNLIMYDRHADSYWPQILGAAVRGPETDRGLQEFRVFWTTWERWTARHPDTLVLSQQTGYARNYRRDPYGSYVPEPSGYYAERSPTIFAVMNDSGRFPPKREVFGFRTATEAVAVDFDALRSAGHLTHQGTDGDYLVLHDPGLDTAWVYRARRGAVPTSIGPVRFLPDGPSGSALEGLEPINGFEAFWFAWYAFYPDTVVLDG
jgi:hypothetical protein